LAVTRMFLVNSLFNFQRPHRLSDFYILSNLLLFVKNFFQICFFICCCVSATCIIIAFSITIMI
ncbi:hypothetical protein EXQ30_04365, partial [Clostridium botulinum]|nr:hypothetical protein [Clostridium botulinum]MBO0546719.1 hypothetical protein [Clostridium botulinum]